MPLHEVRSWPNTEVVEFMAHLTWLREVEEHARNTAQMEGSSDGDG